MFSVGIPLVANIIRGHSDTDAVKVARDVVRHHIDKQNVAPRILNLVSSKVPVPMLGNVVKSLSGVGHDDRDLVKRAREKLQFNKANSNFNLQPNKFL